MNRQQRMRFDGQTYEPNLDHVRLTLQASRVLAVMGDGTWRTLREIAAVIADPEASISARLRDLRKERFGAFTVNRRRRGEGKRGLFEYQVVWPNEQRDWVEDLARPH